MKYLNIKMNENNLINNYTKDDLKEILEIQIENENYEGAKVVKSAIEQYDDCEININFNDDFDNNFDK